MRVVVNDANILIDFVKLKMLIEEINPRLGLAERECESRWIAWEG